METISVMDLGALGIMGTCLIFAIKCITGSMKDLILVNREMILKNENDHKKIQDSNIEILKKVS